MTQIEPAILFPDAGEFMRRLLLHGLPPGVHRIRHFGFLANGHRAAGSPDVDAC